MTSDADSTRRAIFAVARAVLLRCLTGSLMIGLVLFSVLGCGRLKKTETPLPSESADTTANNHSRPVGITLNGNDLGTTGDLRKLCDTVREIMQSRAANGVFKLGSNEIENTVYISSGEGVTVGMLADLIAAVNENGGQACLPINTVSPPRLAEKAKPDPLTLILSAGENRGTLSPIFEVSGREWRRPAVLPSVDILSGTDDLKNARAIGSSIEISANGEYFFNGPTVYLSTMDIDDVEIAQRHVDESLLRTEVATLVSWASSDAIKIVSSDFAPTASLFKVFEAVDATKYKWKIVVWRAKPKPSGKY